MLDSPLSSIQISSLWYRVKGRGQKKRSLHNHNQFLIKKKLLWNRWSYKINHEFSQGSNQCRHSRNLKIQPKRVWKLNKMRYKVRSGVSVDRSEGSLIKNSNCSSSGRGSLFQFWIISQGLTLHSWWGKAVRQQAVIMEV